MDENPEPRLSAADTWWLMAVALVMGVLGAAPLVLFDLPLWAVLLIALALGTLLRPLFGRFAAWRGWL